MNADATRPVKRILVVDDDEVTNKILQTRLKDLQYDVLGVLNGEQALAQFDAFDPDVLFLDVVMPGLSGLEVLDRVRAAARDVAIIMATAYGSEAVAVEALRRGADDYLRKPIQPDEFQQVLARTTARLENNRQSAALRRKMEYERHLLAAELAGAAQIQAELLPRTLPNLPGFELAAQCLPAREIGGDFYDWQEPAPGLFTLALGDVMGKGIPAALLMATIRTDLRAVVRRSPPGEAMPYIVAALNSDFVIADRFVTLFLAQLDVTKRQLRYVDAGHGHGFVRRARGALEKFLPGGLPIGVPFGHNYQEGALTLHTGDALVLYSDGLLDSGPAQFATPETLSQQLQGAASAHEMVERLMALHEHGAPPADDLTVLVLRCV